MGNFTAFPCTNMNFPSLKIDHPTMVCFDHCGSLLPVFFPHDDKKRSQLSRANQQSTVTVAIQPIGMMASKARACGLRYTVLCVLWSSLGSLSMSRATP